MDGTTTIISIVIGFVNMVLGLFVKNTYDSVKEAHTKAEAAEKSLSEFKIHVAANHPTHNNIDARFDKLESKIDKIFDKIDEIKK